MASTPDDLVQFGREITRDVNAAASREWLCTNGLGGFASGAVAGLLTRRYHGLLVAALTPPVGRTVVVAKLDEAIAYAGARVEPATNRWADGTVAPDGYRHIERFRLDGASPVWTYAVAEALIEKRVWMEQGRNTTYVRYEILRACGPVAFEIDAFVNYRDYHSTTRGDGWIMDVAPAAAGLRVTAFPGARPVVIAAPGATCEPTHTWYRGFGLAIEQAGGLDFADDNLLAGRFRITLRAGQAPARQRQVAEACGRHLLTSFGLRSLGPAEPGYGGRYEGGPAARDGRYHQGTGWGWLLGPFALAHLRVYGDRTAARALLDPMANHLSDFTLGSIAEIFDGEAPFSPRGCPAQAWSVAEVLRAWAETA
jgi:glycogen debranching enzyme